MVPRIGSSTVLFLSSIAPAAPIAIRPAASRDTQVYIEDVRFALDELQRHCGRFFRPKGIRWAKVRQRFLRDVRGVTSHQEHFLLLLRLVANLRDGHARVIVPETTRGVAWPDEGPRRGPAMFWCNFGSKVFVKNAWGEAEKAGVRPGMQVLEVDGVPVVTWLMKRIEKLRETRGFSTDNYALFFACHWGLAGPPGSRLRLELETPAGKRSRATIARASRSFVPWGPAFFPPGLKRIGRQRYGRTPAGFGYIHLRDVPGDLPDQLDRMLAELGDVPGLILDCRANGGGGCDHDAVFGRFVPRGHVVAFRKRYVSRGRNPYGGPMIVIVDAGCRSAGETISGIFKEDGRAYMIGPAPTAGMSSQKRMIELPSKLFVLRVSVRSNKGRFNGGQGIEGIGVPPHEIVPYDPRHLRDGVDTLIRRAEALLRDYPKGKVPYRPERFGWKRPPPRARPNLHWAFENGGTATGGAEGQAGPGG